MPFDTAAGFEQGANVIPAITQAQNAAAQNQLKTQQMQTQLAQEQKFSQLLSNMAGQGGGSATNKMLAVGLSAMQAGLPQGVKMVNDAIGAQAKLAEAAARTASVQASQQRAQAALDKQKIATYQQQMAGASGALERVNSPESWAQFGQFMAKNYGDDSFLKMPYDPMEVDSLQSQFMGVKNKLAMMHNRALEQQKQADLDERARHDQVMETAAQARVTAARAAAEASKMRAQAQVDREKRLAKTGGGKSVAPPPQGMVDQAQSMIKRELPEMGSNDSIDMAYSVASQARGLMQTNPGMNAQAAIMQALNEQKDEYVHTGSTWYGRKKDTFVPQGVQPQEQPPAQKTAPQAPPVGTVMQGYRFKGGDPAKESNWERVQ